MDKILQAQFYLDKAVHTWGRESLKAYRALINAMTQNAIPPEALRITPKALNRLERVIAFEVMPDTIYAGLKFLEEEAFTYADDLFARAETLMKDFDSCLPDEAKQSWGKTIMAGMDYAKKAIALGNAERAINAYSAPSHEKEPAYLKDDRINLVRQNLQNAGLSHIYLCGDQYADDAAVRSLRRSTLQDLPALEPLKTPVKRHRLIKKLTKNDEMPIASSYRIIDALTRKVAEETGHERLIALEDLEEALQAAGVSIEENSEERFDRIRTLAGLELLVQEAPQSRNQTAANIAQLQRVAASLFRRPASDYDRSPLDILAEEARTILCHNRRAVFAAAATDAVTTGDRAAANRLLKNYGFETWTIGHIMTSEIAKNHFLARMQSWGPVRSWDAVDQKLKRIKVLSLRA